MADSKPMSDASAETPLERTERQIRALKSGPEFPGGWAELTESGKLDRLDALDWQGVTPLERLCVIEAEVDLNRVSPRTQRNYLGELRDQVMATIPFSLAPPAGADQPPLPSPSEIASNPTAYQPEPPHGKDHAQEHQYDPGSNLYE